MSRQNHNVNASIPLLKNIMLQYNNTYMKIVGSPASKIPHIKPSAASAAFEETTIFKTYSVFPSSQSPTSETI